MSRGALCVAAIRFARDRVRCRYVREWKTAFDEQVILSVALGSSRLRPAIIHTDAIPGGDPLHHAVEDLLPVLGLIEPEITEIIQETAWLRGDLRVDPGNVARERIGSTGVVLRFIAKP